MIELPESHALARQINVTLRGKEIRRTVAAQSPLGFAWYNGDPAAYDAYLREKQILGATAHGGHLQVLLGDDWRLNFDDGIRIRYIQDLAKVPKKHQLYVEFTDDTALVCSVQMYGGMNAYREGSYQSGYLQVAMERPSPLTDAFDEAYFESLRDADSGKLSAKAFLATNQRVPGLGNGVLQDILFNARVHPKRKMKTISDAEYETLYRAVVDTLRAMEHADGRDTEKDIFDNPGGYVTILSKNTVGKPCPVCGDEIQKVAYLGGAIYFCEQCQPLAD